MLVSNMTQGSQNYSESEQLEGLEPQRLQAPKTIKLTPRHGTQTLSSSPVTHWVQHARQTCVPQPMPSHSPRSLQTT